MKPGLFDSQTTEYRFQDALLLAKASRMAYQFYRCDPGSICAMGIPAL